MIDLLVITNDAAHAAQCDRLPGMRLFVDLERNGKAERQAGRGTFISTHQMQDIRRIKAVLRHSPLLVRLNPYQSAAPHAAAAEVDQAIEQGADLLMLPMFADAETLQAFSGIVAGRVPIVPLLETAGALDSIEQWIDTPGVCEVFVGLNDLHVSLGFRFMFEPLALGHVDRVAEVARRAGLRFGFGGIARVGEGLLDGRDVLGEHLRLGSRAVILSRTFNRPSAPPASGDDPASELTFTEAVAQLREAERGLSQRSADAVAQDRQRVARLIGQLAGRTQEAV